MDVRLSAPEYVSQFDATCGRSRMDGIPMVDGRNVDEILAADALEDEMLFTGGGTQEGGRIYTEGGSSKRKHEDVRQWFQKKKTAKGKEVEVVCLSSDDEEVVKGDDDVFMYGMQHNGCDVVDLDDDNDEVEGQGDNGEEVEYVDQEFLDAVNEVENNYRRGNKGKWCLDQCVDLEEDEANNDSNEIKLNDQFRSKEAAKFALQSYAITNLFRMHTIRSSSVVYMVQCDNRQCNFFCRVSFNARIGMFVVKEVRLRHTCGLKIRHDHSKHASSSVIAHMLLKRYDVYINKIKYSSRFYSWK